MMKYLSLLFVAALLLVACSKQSYQVGATGNAAVNEDEKSYNTYAFASQVDSKLDEGLFFLNDLVLKARIRDAVMHEMNAKGFEFDPNSADLIVNFRVFDKPTEIQTADQLGNNYWGANEITGYSDFQTVNLKEGSLIIHIVDRKTGKVVWQGYTSGLMDGNVFNKEEEKIDEAVSMVLDRYNYRADNL